MATGKEIRWGVGRMLNTVRKAPSAPAPFLLVQNTGTSANAVVARDALGSQLYTAQAFQGYFVRVPNGPAASGEKVRATVLDPSTGTLSLSPEFTVPLATGQWVELWHPDVDPDMVDVARDRALATRCTRWRRVPLTYLDDGDMMRPDPYRWTFAPYSGGEKTLTDQVARLYQEQVLTQSAWGAPSVGYAYQRLSAQPGQAWTYAALVRARPNVSAQFEVVSAESGAPIPLEGTYQQEPDQFGLLKGSFVVPPGTRTIEARLKTLAQYGATEWAWVILYPQDARLFLLPERVSHPSQVGTLYELVGDTWPEARWVPLPPAKLSRGQAGAVVLEWDAPGQRLIFWDEFAHYRVSKLAYTYATPRERAGADDLRTLCPLEYAVAATLYELYPSEFKGLYQQWHVQLGARTTPRLFRELYGEEVYA